MFGVHYARLEDRDRLSQELVAAYERKGSTLLEVVVPAHGAVLQQRRLFAAVDASLAAVSGKEPT
jgi:2-succinyl-5-enolpyruvyl-6-hydroxy-3-cyclohexene-1-carboxylate synthase